MDRPPFDAVRAAFYLIAAVLAVHGVVVLAGLGACLYWGEAVMTGRFSCENISATVSQLLGAALSAALAFAAGFSRKDR